MLQKSKGGLIFALVLFLSGSVSAARENFLQKAQQSLDLMSFEQAEYYFKKAIEVDPKEQDMRVGLSFAQFKLEQWEAAVHTLQEELSLFPENVSALSLLGYVLFNQGKLEEAAGVCLQIEETIGRAVLAEQRRIGRNYRLEGENLMRFFHKLRQENPNLGLPNFINGIYYREKGDFKQAERHFSLALERGYDPTQCFIQMANLELLQGKWEAAINACIDVVDAVPNPAELYFIMGYAYCFLGKTESGILFFQRAYKLKPFITETLRNLAKVHYSQNDFSSAQKLLLMILKLVPYDFESKFLLDRTAKDVPILENELKPQLTKSIVDNTSVHYIHTFKTDINQVMKITNETSMTLVRMGRIRDAAEMIAEFLLLNDQSPELNYNLAHFYNMMGELEKALKHAWKCTDLMPDYKDGHDLKGSIFFKFRDFESSLQAYRRVLEIDPKDAMGHYNIGCVYSALKRIHSAEESWKSAILFEKDIKGREEKETETPASTDALEVTLTVKRRPISFEAYKSLGFLYSEKNQSQKALEAFEMAIELDPSDSEPYLEIGKIYAAENKAAEAISYLERYIYLGGQKESEAQSLLAKMKKSSFRSSFLPYPPS